jgi:hypothetical protein
MDLDQNSFIMKTSDDSNEILMRHIRPMQERRSSEWNNDPFDVNPGGSPSDEYEPGPFLLPYYIMLYYGMI